MNWQIEGAVGRLATDSVSASCRHNDPMIAERKNMFKVARTSLIWIAAWLLLTSISVCGYSEFYAVIVGVADYPGTANDLAFTDDDAIAVRDALLSYPNWETGNIIFLLDSAASKVGIQEAIATFASVAGIDDVFVLFFSGHGTTGLDMAPLDEADGVDEYLCAYGSTLEDFVCDDELEGWLATLPMTQIVVMIDTCFSGGQVKGAKSINTGLAPREGDGFCDDLEELTSPYTPQDLDDLTEKELVALAAADDHEYAYELGHPYNHGLFTYYLLEAMLGGADESPIGWISAETSFLYLEPRVVALSSSYGLGQHPQLFDGHPGNLGLLELVGSDICWSFGLNSLQINGYGGGSVDLGVSSDGSDCYDLGLDLPTPPAAPGDEYTRAWLQVDDSCDSAPKLGRDIRQTISCGEVETWYLHIEDTGPEMSVQITWDHPFFDPLPSGMTNVRLTRWPVGFDTGTGQYWINTSGASLDYMDMLQTGSYTYTKSTTYDHSGFTVTIDCRTCAVETANLGNGGWAMVSLPGELCDSCTWTAGQVCGDLVCALEDDLDPFFAYRYSSGFGGYSRIPPSENICYQPGMSVWVHTTEPDTVIDAEVTPIDGLVELSIGNGWNQVGNPYTVAISPSAFSIRVGVEEKTLIEAEAAGWISSELYMYDPAGGNYMEIPLDTGCLPAWTGVWLETTVEGCTLVINPVACTASGPMSRPLSVSEIHNRGLDLPPRPPVLVPLSLEEVAGSISVLNDPNPVRSEHTTVFKVQGAGAEQIDEIRVDIYDQQGLRVFSEQVDEIELIWHTVNNAGELLANGIYLYQVWVCISDIWYPMEVQKLAVVR